MTHVDIDPVRQVARVGGGALWLQVVEAAAAQGFAVLHGSSPDVGVAGYSLGGGIFMYARKLGMQTNALTGVELVTADGTIRWASTTENSALFWALRGGGGNFGIVTTLEFAMFPFRSAYMPGCWCGTGPRPNVCCGAGSSGPPRLPTRSRPLSGC